jgi:uncharacterized membrane protein
VNYSGFFYTIPGLILLIIGLILLVAWIVLPLVIFQIRNRLDTVIHALGSIEKMLYTFARRQENTQQQITDLSTPPEKLSQIVKCPACDHDIVLELPLRGKDYTCPHCKEVFEVS